MTRNQGILQVSDSTDQKDAANDHIGNGKPEPEEKSEVTGWTMSTHRLGTRPISTEPADTVSPIPGPSLKDRIKQLNRKREPDAPPSPQDTEPMEQLLAEELAQESSQSVEPELPAAEPPITEPPAAESPAAEPPITEHPAAEPVSAKPPVTTSAPHPLAATTAEIPAQRAAEPRSPITDDVTGRKPSEEDEAQVLEADPLTEQDMQDIKDQTGGGKPKPPTEEEGVSQQPWQIIFQPTKSKSKAIALEVQNITIVGRADPDCATQPDLDLTPQGGDKLGVSRQHAILMSNVDGLWLIDLDSTNGTWVNGLYLQPGLKYRLRNGDRIEFGSLELAVRVLGALPTLHPDERAGRGATRISRTKPRRY
ncbi:MAG: FHA domain-containing protein [Anaerolineae bacterium]|nr:FHA domain-containing protein [Anaerolineae bacterium]